MQPYTDEKTGQRRVGVYINAHLVDDSGKDLRRVPGRKSKRPGILVRVPSWSEDMWLRRKAAAGSGPLFPSVGVGWLDQANCNKRLRTALDGAGFDWVTALVWRKAVGTLMRRAGRSSEDIASACDLYRTGWSLERIAQKFGVSDGSVWRRLREAGVQMRPQKGGRQPRSLSHGTGAGSLVGRHKMLIVVVRTRTSPSLAGKPSRPLP